MMNEQTKTNYPDTLAGAHAALKAMMNAKRYAKYYEGMPAYPGQLPGEWLIVSRHPDADGNCAHVILAGYGGRYGASQPRDDFEEGYSRDVARNERVV